MIEFREPNSAIVSGRKLIPARYAALVRKD